MVLAPLIRKNYEASARFLEQITNGDIPRSFWLDRFEYWWHNNPNMNDAIPRGWILLSDDGKIGGFLGNIPVKYQINGQEQIVCGATSWYVAPDFAKKGMELFYAFLKQPPPFLDTTPTEKVARVLRGLKFFQLKKEWLKREAIYPIQAKEFWVFIVNKFSSNKYLEFALKLIGLLVVPLIAMYQKAYEFKILFLDKKYEAKEIIRFDSSYSQLWTQLKNQYKVIAVRDWEALNWYFFGSKGLLATRKVIGINKNGVPIGYAALKLITRTIRGRTYYHFELIDMVMIEKHESAYYALLKGLLSFARSYDKKIAFIKIIPFDENMKTYINKLGFLWQTMESRFYYRGFAVDSSSMPDAMEKSFYATPLDGDRGSFP